MSELQTMALQDCIAKKQELAAEIARLQLQLKAASELAAKWEQTAIEIHDDRMRLHGEIKRVRQMTLWQHFRMWRYETAIVDEVERLKREA